MSKCDVLLWAVSVCSGLLLLWQYSEGGARAGPWAGLARGLRARLLILVSQRTVEPLGGCLHVRAQRWGASGRGEEDHSRVVGGAWVWLEEDWRVAEPGNALGSVETIREQGDNV